MLIQIDGSPHEWLEGRGPAMSLLAGVDDATGKIPFALFRPTEDAAGYFMLLRGIVARWGIPLALYHDRHQIFRANTKREPSLAEELSGRQDRPTHFGQLLQELAIASIAAHSPQAKGRIERLFGTLQDRLVAQLRLAGAVSLEEANRVLWAYLEPFNRRFAVPARDAGLAYRAPEEGFRAEMVFCFKYERKVAPDNTVGFDGHRLQLLPQGDHGSYAGRTVQVQEGMDGSVAVSYQGRIVGTRPAPVEAPVLRTRKRERSPEGVAPPGGTAAPGRPGSAAVAAGAVGKWSGSAEAVHLSTARPSPSHPWRRYANKPGVTDSQDTNSALVFVRVSAPQLGAGQVFGDGLRSGDPVPSQLPGLQPALSGQELQVGLADSIPGRCLLKGDELIWLHRHHSRNRLGHYTREQPRQVLDRCSKFLLVFRGQIRHNFSNPVVGGPSSGNLHPKEASGSP